MRTLTTILTNQTERMGRRLVRDSLLQNVAKGGSGIRWEFHPTVTDFVMFQPSGETRECWFDLAAWNESHGSPGDRAEDGDNDSEFMSDGARQVAGLIVADILYLIGSRRDDRRSAAGQFLLECAPEPIPVSVVWEVDGDGERLELRFAATPSQQQSAARALELRRANRTYTAPIAPDEPDIPPRERPLWRRVIDAAAAIFFWSLILVLACVTLLQYPLAGGFAFAWGAGMVLWLLRFSQRSSAQSETVGLWFSLGSFLLLFILPTLVGALVLRNPDAIGLVAVTFVGFVTIGLFLFRNTDSPPVEPL